MPSANIPIVSFSTRIESDLVSVEAGATVPVGVEVENRSEAADRFEIQIEGLDPEWTAIPVPVFPVNPGDKGSEKLFFKPPRASESLAGNYPFVVRIRSMETGEARTVQGVLQIKPFHHLSLELNPKRGSVSPWRNQNEFHVTVMNLGNTEHTLQLYGNDPDEALAFEFEQEQITVGPGQQKTVEVYADPTSQRTFSSSRLYMFSISARSIEQPSIVTASQAQLEQKPLLSPASMIGAVLVLAILGLWVYMLPKPAKIERFSVEPGQIEIGQRFQLTWATSRAQKVRISVAIQPPTGTVTTTDLGEFDPQGRREFPDTGGVSIEGNYTFKITAIGDNSQQSQFSPPVTAVRKPTLPPPVIAKFEISSREVNKGDSFMVRYRVANAAKITLDPDGLALDPKGKERLLEAKTLGTITYTLRAENAEGSVAEKQITVRVLDPTMPRIVSFEVAPKEVPEGGGTIRVTWQFANTVNGSRKLKVGDAESIVLDAERGTIEVNVSGATTITLSGTDDKGRSVEKTASVKLAAPRPPETTGGDLPPATTGAGTTTSTGGGG